MQKLLGVGEGELVSSYLQVVNDQRTSSLLIPHSATLKEEYQIHRETAHFYVSLQSFTLFIITTIKGKL